MKLGRAGPNGPPEHPASPWGAVTATLRQGEGLTLGTLALNPQPLVSPTAETRPGETVTTPGGTPPLADAAGARVVLRFDLEL